ncbi:Acyltransferase family protein [Amycolatopsis arida]|uniref:Acyltransferase family protein n=1 Tax=Amycolatopsis arida TaxID=587909 RepID=A0A1I5MMJ7_9PSEU|nr:acyltransferase [Amycolatopsis arida]TDX94127.1 acyltransferase-like protein [Amycolatopsis arida]SFP10141.1 Acyltransferase family protein [Amycolatopsis arida]
MQTSPRSLAAGRDVFLDLVRAGAILAVVLQHWLMPVLAFDGTTIATGNALTTPGWWAFTWLSQVMPLVFFAGGAANLLSLRRAASTRAWLAARAQRLLLPVLPLAAVWLVVPEALRELGVPEQPVAVAGSIAGQLLWFLAVYLVTVLLAPVMAAAHRRWGLAVPVLLTAAAAVVDVARFGVAAEVGYLNAVFVWVAVHQLGFCYVEGPLAGLGRRAALGLAATGFGGAAVLVTSGPYAASMIGMPGAPMSNMSPPTMVLVAVALGQLGLLLAARPALTAFAARPPVAAALGWLGARFMSIYLWHMPALIVVTGVAVLGFGYATPEPGTPEWLAAAPVWLVLAAGVLLALLRVVAGVEARRPARSAPPALPQLVVAMTLGAAGLLGLAARGFTTPVDGGWQAGPLPWVALVLGGFLLARRALDVAELAGRALAVWQRARRVAP